MWIELIWIDSNNQTNVFDCQIIQKGVNLWFVNFIIIANTPEDMDGSSHAFHIQNLK